MKQICFRFYKIYQQYVSYTLLLKQNFQQQYLFRRVEHMEMETQLYSPYQPLKWPPDLALAKLHIRCSCPGKDNIDGIECPCCGRYQKLKTRNWYSRDIVKDFKSYGGGIPSYFQLIKYCIGALLILALIINLYHIYVLQTVCPLLHEQQIAQRCQTFLVIFKLCDPAIIYKTLVDKDRVVQANIFFYLQMVSFIYLILATVGMKIWLQRINANKVVKQQKVYSNFSLMLKNIPRFYSTQDIKKQLKQIVPNAQINQLFFVYEIAELQTKFKQLFDLGFEIEYIKQSITQQRGESEHSLHKKLQQFIKLYEQVELLKKKIGQNNGRAIVVFNNKTDRNIVRKKLKINECNKFVFHSMKLIGLNTQKMHMIADKIPEPQEIIWKYVGQCSDTKTKVRIQTSFIGLGFMLICFGLLYFPIVKIDENNIKNHSMVSTVLGILISTLLQVLAIIYRQIILKLIPRRHPSSRQSQSYFIVITTVVFHFMFYLVAPVSYFILTDIPRNFKLKQLFIAILIFLVMTLIVAIIDLRYRLSKSRRKKILSGWANWGKYCQMRLHEQLKWPSFPIEFKLMVILNIWSFNAFYIFQIPYLLVIFVLIMFIIYWIDKKNIYKHYKMQVFLSIDLELSVQRDYIVMFLVCVCSGYAVCAQHDWQYVLAGVMFILCFILNLVITYQAKNSKKRKQVQKTMTLNQVIKSHSINPKMSMRQNLLQMELRQNFMAVDQKSTISLGSVSFEYGYKQLYDNYLNYFKNRNILSFLQNIFHHNKRRLTNLTLLMQNKQPVDQSFDSDRSISKGSEGISNQGNLIDLNRKQSYQGFAENDKKLKQGQKQGQQKYMQIIHEQKQRDEIQDLQSNQESNQKKKANTQ